MPREGDRVIINTAHVHAVGAQIKQDAQTFLDSAPESIHDFQNTLNNLNDVNFPVQLFSTFYEFINIHTTAFTQIFQDRQAIGDTLQDSASKAELTEVKIVASFTPDPLSGTDGPAQFQFPS